MTLTLNINSQLAIAVRTPPSKQGFCLIGIRSMNQVYETGRVRDHILAGLPHLLERGKDGSTWLRFAIIFGLISSYLARVPGLDEYWMLVEPQGCPDDKGVRIIAEAFV